MVRLAVDVVYSTKLLQLLQSAVGNRLLCIH